MAIQKPKRRCTRPNCNGFVISGICNICGTLKTGAAKVYDDSRGNSYQRGYDYQWHKLRNYVLRKQPLCVHCKAKGLTTLATEVDHIIPLANAGTNELNNLQGLCHSCHMIKTNNDKKIYTKID